MRAERVAAAADFLAATVGVRGSEPVMTNVLGTVAQSVVEGRRYASCWWWLVRDDEGDVVGCAARTAPWNLAVSPMPLAAATALGRAVAGADPGLPGVTGERAVAQAVLTGFGSPRAAFVAVEEVVHVLAGLRPPAGVPGAARQACRDEVELLVQWHEQFASDAGLPARDLLTSVEQRLRTGGLWWWMDGDERVSMAGHVAPLATPGGAVGRIGPVFTPERFRRRGYAGAVTAAVVEQLLPRCATVMLLADAANPTSNGVYERLGFSPVAYIVELNLTS